MNSKCFAFSSLNSTWGATIAAKNMCGVYYER